MDITEATEAVLSVSWETFVHCNVPEPLALLCKMAVLCFGVKGSAC